MAVPEQLWTEVLRLWYKYKSFAMYIMSYIYMKYETTSNLTTITTLKMARNKMQYIHKQLHCLPANQLQMTHCCEVGLKEMKLPETFPIGHILLLQLPLLSQLTSNTPKLYKCHIITCSHMEHDFRIKLETLDVWTSIL